MSGWGDLDSDPLSRSAHAVAGKLLHRTTIAARQAAAAGDADRLRHLCEMFGVPLAQVGLAKVDRAAVDKAVQGGGTQRIAVCFMA
jgi:hypothetical protein